MGELGRTIPESTIRVMRDKYLVKKNSDKEVTEVECKTRGRPTAMGKYDKTLMDTLARLEEKGEKINAFAVIATAKQILSEHSPEAMQTDVNLTPNWAKSIL